MQHQPGLDFQLFFENTPTPCMVINREFEVVAVSNAFLAVTFSTREKIVGRKLTEAFPDNPNDNFSKNSEQSRRTMQQVFESGTALSSKINKYDIPHPDGGFVERFWKDINIPLRNQNNEVAWVLHCTEDITESILAKQDEIRWGNKLSETSMQAEDLRLLSGHLHNAREDERARIAREIHDGLGQQLSVIKMDVNWISRKITQDNEPVKEKIKEINAMLAETVKLVRRISSELRPSLLDDMGLLAAIEWQLGEFSKQNGIAVHFQGLEEEPEISEQVKLNMFRILQDCLANVWHHANAKTVWVNVLAEDNNLLLTIKDDGVGFDTSKKTTKHNIGLLSMKERALMMGATYVIDSSAASGTSVKISVKI